MEQITKYFNAEKQESIIFIFVGLLTLLISFYFLLKVKQPFNNGMAYSLIAIALIQITVGGSVYLRSPKDITRVTEIIQSDKARMQSEEIPRMEVVMKNFTIYRWAEIFLLIVGIVMYLYFQPSTLLKGLGLGLAIQAGFMLLLDYFAEHRGGVYLDYLKNL
jgi:multidrug transporter EmrE-like cation transporter